MSSPISIISLSFKQLLLFLLWIMFRSCLPWKEKEKHKHLPILYTHIKLFTVLQNQPHNSDFPEVLHSYTHSICSSSVLCAWDLSEVHKVCHHWNRMWGVGWWEMKWWLASSLVGHARNVESILQLLANHCRVRAWLCNVSVHKHQRWERELKARAEAA